MPELPEVESYRRALELAYRGKRILGIAFHRDDIRAPLDRTGLRRVFARGATLVGLGRDGKRLVLTTDRGEALVSLGMSGSFHPGKSKKMLHEHVTLRFEDGTRMAYVDPRRFGHWEVRVGQLPHLADPLDEGSLRALFASPRWTRSERSVKDALLDQREIGGIGNIYALEALHLSGVDPRRTLRSLSTKERVRIVEALPPLLHRAIERGGSSIATYRTLSGERGDFQDLHRVYDREGEGCPKRGCGGTIVRIAQGGRGSWLCPACQR